MIFILFLLFAAFAAFTTAAVAAAVSVAAAPVVVAPVAASEYYYYVEVFHGGGVNGGCDVRLQGQQGQGHLMGRVRFYGDPAALPWKLLTLPHYRKELLLGGKRYYHDPVSSMLENIDNILDYEDAAPSVRTRKDKYGEDIHAPSSRKRTMESRNKEGRSRIYKEGKKRRVRPPHKRW